MDLTGSIINAPVHNDIAQKEFPHFVNETTTITIALKKRFPYKNAYQIEKLRVHIFIKALKELCSIAL